MKDNKEFDWLEDPFNEKNQPDIGMKSKNKTLMGCGCLVVVIASIVFIAVLIFGISDILA